MPKGSYAKSSGATPAIRPSPDRTLNPFPEPGRTTSGQTRSSNDLQHDLCFPSDSDQIAYVGLRVRGGILGRGQGVQQPLMSAREAASSPPEDHAFSNPSGDHPQTRASSRAFAATCPVTFLPKSRNSPTDRADALSRGNFFVLQQSDSRVSLFYGCLR